MAAPSLRATDRCPRSAGHGRVDGPWGGKGGDAFAQVGDASASTAKAGFPAGTRLTVPDGGMLLWLQRPEGAGGDRLFAQALGRGIKIAPGSMFSAGRRFDGSIRLGCGLRPGRGRRGATRAARAGRAVMEDPALSSAPLVLAPAVRRCS